MLTSGLHEKCTHTHVLINMHTHTFAHTHAHTHGPMLILYMSTISYPKKTVLRKGCIWDESGDCYTLLTLLHVSQWYTPDLLCLFIKDTWISGLLPVHLLFLKTHIWFPVATSSSSQLPITLFPGDPILLVSMDTEKKNQTKTWISCSHLDFISKIVQMFGCNRNALVLLGTVWWKGWHCAKW